MEGHDAETAVKDGIDDVVKRAQSGMEKAMSDIERLRGAVGAGASSRDEWDESALDLGPDDPLGEID